jgi:hypothetical protein
MKELIMPSTLASQTTPVRPSQILRAAPKYSALGLALARGAVVKLENPVIRTTAQVLFIKDMESSALVHKVRSVKPKKD